MNSNPKSLAQSYPRYRGQRHLVPIFSVTGLCHIFFLPFNILFRDGAPAFSAYGKALVSVIDVDFDVRFFAFSVPRIFAGFDCFS